MKLFHAKAQRRKDVLRFSFAPLRLCVEKLVAITIALSFIAFLAPIASASRDKSSTMPCCVGKSAGHCDSGITPIPDPQPKSEALCGLDSAGSEDDGITIVAEPVHTESHHSLSQSAETTSSAAESNSFSKPCPMDCGACTASATRQQKRERGIVRPAAYHNSLLTISSRYENSSFSFLSNEDWEQTSPRGPPIDLL
jgi:hypothetical protein